MNEDAEANDGRKGVVGIKKTDLEFEEKHEKLSVVFFRLNEIFNLKDKENQKRDFDLLEEGFKK